MTKVPALRRHLDHLQDITNGQPWTPMPEPLRSLWFHGEISDKKCKLIMIMLTHGANFHIKRAYLKGRCKLHGNTLKKFLVEIEEDGIVRVEKVRLENGSMANVYHTNPVSEWRLREAAQGEGSEVNPHSPDAVTCTGSLVNHSPVNHSPVNPLNKNKGKPEKEEPEKMVGWNEPSQPVERAPSDPLDDPSLIDDCKRLEYCYKTKDTDYVNYKRTRALLAVIRSNHGQDRLDHFIGWMESRWQDQVTRNPKFAFRPERMASHWLEYLEAHPKKPEPVSQPQTQ